MKECYVYGFVFVSWTEENQKWNKGRREKQVRKKKVEKKEVKYQILLERRQVEKGKQMYKENERKGHEKRKKKKSKKRKKKNKRLRK